MCVLRYRQQRSSLLLKFIPGLFGRGVSRNIKTQRLNKNTTLTLAE